MPAEQMVRTFYSSLRNPTIAKLFRFANISENVGFGMGKLFSWKQLTGNEVTCESDRNVVRVTLFLKNNRLRGKCPWMETYPPSQIS